MTKKYVTQIPKITIALPKHIIPYVRSRLKDENLGKDINVVDNRHQKQESFISYEYIKNENESTSFVLRGPCTPDTDEVLTHCIIHLAKEVNEVFNLSKHMAVYMDAINFLNIKS